MDFDTIDRTARIGLDLKKYQTDLRKALYGLAADISKFQIAINADDIAEIERIGQSLRKIVENQTKSSLETARIRRENLIRFQDVEICSLGYDCFARTVCTRWGLKKPAKLGEKSSPFDLAIHPAEAVLEILRGDFALYTSPEITYSEELGHYVIERLRMKFNHDKNLLSEKDSLKALRSRYLQRAENFRKAMANPKPMLFVHHSHDAGPQSQEAVAAIFRHAAALRGDRPSAFVWICNQYGEQQPIRFAETRDTRLLDLPYPSDSYKWWKISNSFSGDGLRFERKVIAWLTDVVAEQGWIAKDA